MPISTSRKDNKKKITANGNESRAALEQKALEGRGRDIYKYIRKHGFNNFDDENLLYLSYLWLACDARRELSVDEFMSLTIDQIKERINKLKTKNHLQKLTSFDKILELCAVKDNEVEVPYRYAK